MLRILLLFGVTLPTILLGQTITDDFTDGNFQNPLWQGDTALFVQVGGELQSNGPSATATLSMATAAPVIGDTEWRLTLDYAFAPSTSNFLRFYLMADSVNVSGDLHGYFVQAGESGSNDSYDLFRQDGATTTKLIDGVDGRAANEIATSLRIRRTAAGLWTLESSDANGLWRVEGDTTDITYGSADFLGIYLRHSSTRNQSFFFDDLYAGPWDVDLTPPTVLSVIPASENEVIVTFSEPMDSVSMVNPANYTVDQGIGSPFLAQRISSSKVMLEFLSSFSDAVTYTVSASQVQDLAGNVIASGAGASFTYAAPIQYTFGMMRINEVMFDPTPANGLPEVEYVELLNMSNETLEMGAWSLRVNFIEGNIDSFVVAPNGLVLLTAPDDVSAFAGEPVVAVSPWPALVNTGRTLQLFAPNGTLVDSFSYTPAYFSIPSKTVGGFSLELINPNNLTCPPVVNWDGSIDPKQGTPGQPNSLFDPTFDSEPALPVSAIVTGPNLIELCFNKPMDRSNLSDPAAFLLEGFAVADEINVIDPFARCIELAFGGVIPAGQVFTLRISGQSSCFGNGPAEATISVFKGIPAVANQVLINEFMPDETPRVGLPEAEFIELFNSTSLFLDISGGGISDGGAVKNWGQAQLAPGGYAILCDRGDSLQFAAFGPVIAVDGLPSLNNSGDSLTLSGPDGSVWDQVLYAFSWYVDLEKSTGGYSIEKINPQLGGCNLPGNWRASVAPAGGTPGKVNSVDGPYEDRDAPAVSLLRFVDEQTLVVTFSEPMRDDFAMESRYTVLPLGKNPLVVTASKANTEIFLLFDEVFEENEVFTLRIDTVFDCSGNPLVETLSFGRPVAMQPGDVLISEVLANPFSGGSDFVEIYNASANVLDLSELNIGEGIEGTDSVFNADPVTSLSVIFLPGQYLCLTRDVAFQVATYVPQTGANFLEMNAFPTYDDAAGEVVIFTDSGRVMDRFPYLDDYHYADLRDENGISLERISFSVPATQPDNWHSAASTVRFATPGYANSQALASSDSSDDPIWLEPSTFTPDGDGVDDVLGIHYQFDMPGMNARVTVLDRAGRVVKTVRRQELLGTGEGSFFWDGRSDSGTRLPLGPYVVLVEVTNQNDGSRAVYRKVAVIGG
ncbi:MAG: lamin tail domain-containing protein [Bacteroidia bacterium]|nr:lamin tail domain-containing protein [Bacteroidia bacterium]